jgi:biotin operon repressor
MLEFGYIRLYRSLLDWEWYTDSNTKDVFIHLLLTANYEDKKWKGITIRRGQRVYSTQKLADELHMSRQVIRTAIKHLISTGEITNESTPEYSIITVKNYDSYQQLTNNPTNEQPTPNQRATNEQPQCKKDKESNKDKKDKKDICADAFITYANGDSDLLKALNDYAEMRKQKKKQITTDRAIKMLFSRLDKLASDNKGKIAILNQSVFYNWTGVFPLKDNQQQKPSKPEKQYSFDIDEYERTSFYDNMKR